MKLVKTDILLIFCFLCAACVRSPKEPETAVDSSRFDACISYPGAENRFEVTTFNVKGFPLDGSKSVSDVASLLLAIHSDVYALQEVGAVSRFNRLVDMMDGYTGLYYLIDNNKWNLAYLFKKSEVSVDEDGAELLFSDDPYYFPRPAFKVKVHHKRLGMDIYIINNHLKCCSGSENELRRRKASVMLKNYIDSNLNDKAVIVLGDLNDEIGGISPSKNPFLNFIDDSDNYRFADMGIAKGNKLWWSYPSWPSHIDHILVTDELFNRIDTTVVHKAAPCYSDYSITISDHRPVTVILK